MDVWSVVLNDLVSDPSEKTTQQLVNFISDKQSKSSWPKRVIPLGGSPPPDVEIKQEVNVKVRFNTLVQVLLESKRQLDDDGITDFVLVTSRVMKKVLERLCYLLFSHVHNWTVIGVVVLNQNVGLPVPGEKDLEDYVRNYLKSVPSQQDVLVLRANTFPKNMFNAGFSTRQGGLSSLKPLASMNTLYTIAKPDPLVMIEENRRRLALTAGFELETFNVAKVEHGTTIWVVEKPEEKPFKYDGLVTNTPGVTVAAPGADCCMILLGDLKTGACGAVHSGWLGTAKGAVISLLKTMIGEYGTDPIDVLASIGPSVEATCFTLPVGDCEVFAALDSTLTWSHKTAPGISHIDLVRANAVMLEQEGVPSANIDMQHAKCTACHEDLFFSHRRDGFPFGNQIGFIKRMEHTTHQ